MRSSTPACSAALLALLLGVLALLAAPAPAAAVLAKYSAKLTPTPAYHATIPPKAKNNTIASGEAVISVFNATYAEVAYSIKGIAFAFMAHIHNGTLTANGPPIVWAFQSTLPSGGNNPISGTFYGTVAFNPTTTGVITLLPSATTPSAAYFNVHTTPFPAGAIAGQFKKV